MILTLEVTGPEAGKLGAACRKAFNAAGGTIGRLPDNDLVLPDRYISGRHAVIHFSNGTYFLEDRSSNGICINSPEARLPKNEPYALKDGDRFFIELYEIRVSIAPGTGASAPSGSPLAGLFGAPGGAPLPDDPFAAADAFGPVTGATSRSVPSLSPVAGPSSIEPLPTEETDPLKLLGLEPSRHAAAPVPRAEELARASPLVEPYRPPAVVPPTSTAPPASATRAADPIGAGVIPEDYDPLARDDSPSTPPPLRGATSQASGGRPALRTGPSQLAAEVDVAPRALSTTPSSARSDPPQTGPNLSSAPARGDPAPRTGANLSPASTPIDASRAAQAPSSALARGDASRPVPNLERPSARPLPGSTVATQPQKLPSSQGMPTAASVQSPAVSPAAVDFTSLLAAAGVDGAAVTPELAATFGRILRVVVTGIMDLLRAREHIKDEFRMRMTTFKAADNNPLKFSVNVEDALHNLLVKRNPAYLPPVEAFEDAFQDARNHQMAMLAGLRVAFDAMLAEFDPEHLQEQFGRQIKKSSLLPTPARLKYWELYRERYRSVVKDADTAFRELFGATFAKAYEEQMQRLKTTGRAQNRS
jgi:type VI secretion system FHA domain protein